MPGSTKYILPITMAILSMLLAACRTTGNRYRTADYLTDNRRPELRYISVVDKFGKWKSFSAKGKFKLTSDKESFSASMQLRMVKDKYIAISLRPALGIEAGRIYMTSDSLYIIDKVNKCFIAEELSMFTAGFPVNIHSLQDIFLCRAFDIEKGTCEARDLEQMLFSPLDDSGNFEFSPRNSPVGTKYSFTVNGSNLLTGFSVSSTNEDVIYEVIYSGHIIIDGMTMATRINLVSHFENYNLAIQTDFTPERIELNGDYNDTPPSLKGYANIPGEMLLMQLSNEF